MNGGEEGREGKRHQRRQQQDWACYCLHHSSSVSLHHSLHHSVYITVYTESIPIVGFVVFFGSEDFTIGSFFDALFLLLYMFNVGHRS